jgi:hypothetical protein
MSGCRDTPKVEDRNFFKLAESAIQFNERHLFCHPLHSPEHLIRPAATFSAADVEKGNLMGEGKFCGTFSRGRCRRHRTNPGLISFAPMGKSVSACVRLRRDELASWELA